jgi:hypothetical protein
MILMGAGAVGLIALDGWLKLLGVVAIGAGFLQYVATHQQAQIVGNSYTCVTANTSW